MNIKGERWFNDKNQVVNKINYHGELILTLTNDDWNIEEVLNEHDRLVITIERKTPTILQIDLKDELIEKLLRYGFSSVDMTVTEFVEDFFKKYL